MLNILQLCAGKGSRFSTYTHVPKPFIDINGTPLFKLGLESISIDARIHCLFQSSHVSEYNPEQYTNAIIHTIDEYTNGAATSAFTVISKSEYRYEPWIIIDCDFLLECDTVDFLNKSSTSSVVFVEECPFDPKSSYTCVDDDMTVLGVAEKQPISKYRNTGQYHFCTGDIFCEAYIFYRDNNLTFSDEFFVAPLYNYLIQNDYSVKATKVKKFIPFGTPYDINNYLQSNNLYHSFR